MKNIHLIPTSQPSRLYLHSNGELQLRNNIIRTSKDYYGSNQHIYITNSEEIKVDDWVITNNGLLAKVITEFTWHFINSKKIILTTDQSLDGVQAIDDDFLEWFVKNPSCESVEIEKTQFNPVFDEDDLSYDGMTAYYTYKIIIPKEELHSVDDEIECNNCSNIMSLTEDGSIYVCYNSECTSCYETYEEEEPKDVVLGYKTSLDAQMLDKVILEEPKQEYEYIGECKGNNGNGCFMDNPAHNCGCFVRKPKQETPKETAARLFTKERCPTSFESLQEAFISNAKFNAAKSEIMYTEEEVYSILEQSMKDCHLWELEEHYSGDYKNLKEWFEQFKK